MPEPHWLTDLPHWHQKFALTRAGTKLATALNLVGDVRLGAKYVDNKVTFVFVDAQNASWAQDRLEVDYPVLEQVIAWQVEHAALDIAEEVMALFTSPEERRGPDR